MDIKDIVKGKAELECIKSGGIAVYKLTDINGNEYMIDIDLSDKHDVGESAIFEVKYDKAITLMRWIRRAIDENTIICLK